MDGQTRYSGRELFLKESQSVLRTGTGCFPGTSFPPEWVPNVYCGVHCVTCHVCRHPDPVQVLSSKVLLKDVTHDGRG